MADKDTQQLLVRGSVLVAYLALGIAIWQISSSNTVVALLAELTYILAVSTALLLSMVQAKSRQLSQTSAELLTAKEEGAEAELLRSLSSGTLSLMVQLTEEPLSDTQHHFSRVEQEFIVTGDDGTYNWRLEGHNDSQDASDAILFKIAGDSPTDYNSMSAILRDTLDNDAPLAIGVIRDLPYFKAIRLEFGRSIAPGDRFGLSLTTRWPNTFASSRKNDYVFFSLGQYAAKGIDQFVARVVCDVPIERFLLERLDSAQRVPEVSQPVVRDSTPNHFVLEWAVSHPTHVYLLTFQKGTPP